ncbi:bifunctional adenosylcobinamide kinase/adenosylcobinamide-phosphate guanylyltransferase [soil metagenome]
MRVLLLGSACADGWPDAVCGCDSCADALRRGVVRRPTSVLVDDAVVLDLGAESAGAAVRAGRSLASIRALLLSGAHPVDPSVASLAANWSPHDDRPAPMVVGNEHALVGCRSAVSTPGQAQNCVEVRPGDRLSVESPAGAYDVEVLAAQRAGASAGVCGYLLTAADGSRLLYAAGSLPEASLAALAGRHLRVLLLAADMSAPLSSHQDLEAFAVQVAALRAVGVVDHRTEVIATHLGHCSPPDVEARLAAVGARTGHDLETIAVGAEREIDRPGHRTLVLGAARSGKSSTAERLATEVADELAGRSGSHTHPVTYVATGPATGSDPEWAERVRRHRERRPARWRTVETTDVASLLADARGPVLVDCLTLWLTALLDAAGAWDARPGWREHVDREVTRLADAWVATPMPVIAVSNEVGAGVVPSTAAGRLFRDEQGRLNARLAATADRCLLVVAGRTLELPQ